MPERLPTLGHATIDTLHVEAEQLLQATLQAGDSELGMRLDTLYQHTLRHFAKEEELMLNSGYRGLSEHRHEHLRLLGEMEGMIRALQRGRRPLVRSWLCDRLPEWLLLHISQLDAQLVRSIGRQGE